MRLKPGCETIYQEKHDAVWPEIVELLRRNGIRNYSIFRRGLDLFAYLESDTLLTFGGEVDPVQRDWWLMMEPYMEYNEDHRPTIEPLEEVFHLD
jgi:L-rhamnose mutarotase